MQEKRIVSAQQERKCGKISEFRIVINYTESIALQNLQILFIFILHEDKLAL